MSEILKLVHMQFACNMNGLFLIRKFAASLKITTINHVCSSLCNISGSVERSSGVLIIGNTAIICRHTLIFVAVGSQQWAQYTKTYMRFYAPLECSSPSVYRSEKCFW
jgi:hypothetical protein